MRAACVHRCVHGSRPRMSMTRAMSRVASSDREAVSSFGAGPQSSANLAIASSFCTSLVNPIQVPTVHSAEGRGGDACVIQFRRFLTN